MSGTSNASLPGEAESLDLRPAGEVLRQLEENRPIKMAIILALGVMITLGNIAVVMVISSAVPGWSRNSRYFLLSLTGADSAFGLVVMPLNLCVSLLKHYNDGPDPFCHVVAFFNATVYSTCMYTLASISLERYLAVFYPLQYSTLLSRRRALSLIALAWGLPPVLLAPVSWPQGIIQVRFSAASLVCNPAYSSNVVYSLALTALIFFPCSAIMTFCNLRLWTAAKRHRLKLRTRTRSSRNGPDVASRVLVPVMTIYYTCWTPCMVIMIYNAMSGSGVPEWVEFVAVWLPTSNGFLNCIFYFWINKNFRRKFHLLLHKLCVGLCPSAEKVLGCAKPLEPLAVPAWNNNNSLHERSSSVSSTCTLLTIAAETYI
ncbi:melatonin receptor type 1A-like [Astyanax mexicanus]|uniref:Adrenoceptor beta 3 n=1 Tax=Astyanax mexicanus TaxID=7994 RepID=A0A8B9L264_ASTMX|nr:melatonin receptor type 1A-like [Astyanax mexicanus]